MKGYKTYAMAGLLGAVTVGHALGYIPDGTYGWLSSLLGAGGLAALRNAIPAAP